MMASAEETGLLTALFTGHHETPYWSTFLHRLLGRTRADHVSLIVARPGEQVRHARQWFAGQDVRSQALELGDLAFLDPTPYHGLRPGRVYTAMELIDPNDFDHRRFRKDYLEKLGIHHGRYMRVTEPGGLNAWLVVSRRREEFSATDSAVMSALAPYLSAALRNLAVQELNRLRLSAIEDVLGRAGIGWALEDASGSRIDVQALLPPEIDGAGQLERGRGSSAPASRGDKAERLVCPLPEHDLVTIAGAARLSLTRQERPFGEEQVDATMRLFGLTRSEARLSLLLAQGARLVEAAETLGITIETARNYSKRAFEKTGTHGQADLVRRILSSIVVLA